MVYTRNTPQGADQILTTQPLILGNFQFIKDSVEVEHNFNAAGTGTDMYHLKASMPNRALSPALLAGTQGVYFVSSAKPYFYDGTTNSNMSCWQETVSGTANFTTAGFTGITILPANVTGIILLFKLGVPPANSFAQSGIFSVSATQAFGFSDVIKVNHRATDYIIELNNGSAEPLPGTRQLQGRSNSATYDGLYTYRIFYRAI